MDAKISNSDEMKNVLQVKSIQQESLFQFYQIVTTIPSVRIRFVRLDIIP